MRSFFITTIITTTAVHSIRRNDDKKIKFLNVLLPQTDFAWLLLLLRRATLNLRSILFFAKKNQILLKCLNSTYKGNL